MTNHWIAGDFFIGLCVMTAAAVAATGMAFAMAMMVAMYSRVIGKVAGQEIIYGLIGFALYTAIEGYADLSQRVLGAATNTATDKGIDFFFLQQCGQSAMTGTVAVQNMGFLYLIVFYSIDFELAGMAKVLKDKAIFIGNGNFHDGVTSFLSGKSHGMAAMLTIGAQFEVTAGND